MFWRKAQHFKAKVTLPAWWTTQERQSQPHFTPAVAAVGLQPPGTTGQITGYGAPYLVPDLGFQPAP